jgi:aldehyde:ferredoxin oxidoreductase
MSEEKQGPGGNGGGLGPPPEPSQSKPMGGYNGKLLRVNLTDKTVGEEAISYELARRYVGGAGFVAHFLWKELKGGEDALGPENKLVFALGPLSGYAIPGASRYCVGAKSPLTGGIAKSESGGFWMAEFKRAGFDVMMIEGRAEKPTYLWITDGKLEFKDASHLWGKETKETQNSIRAELGDEKIQVASIGPGGENLVLYACIMSGLYDAVGRGGLGAVMGSKNLKAIAVRGQKLPAIADETSFREIRKQLASLKHPLSEFGTGGPELPFYEQSGNLPVRNFRDGLFPNVTAINGVAIKEKVRVGMEGCYACPVRCKKVVKFEEPYKCDPDYGGPEYETIAALGSNCGVDDVKAMCKGNERCNAYSLDTISTGVSISFAMEAYERGLISKEDTGGIDLRFGNGEAMLEMIELIATRRGFGNFVAEGTARMAKKLGHDSVKFAMNGKGLEPGMHEPRINFGLKMGFTINPHGADHVASFGGGTAPMGIADFSQFGILAPVKDEVSPKRISLYKLTHCQAILNDMLIMCLFPMVNNDMKLALIKAVTGWNTGWVDLLQTAERTLTTMRMFNLREGFTAADDTLPERFFQPKTDGVVATMPIVSRDEMERAKKLYYFFMGWDEKGVPAEAKLAELEIE